MRRLIVAFISSVFILSGIMSCSLDDFIIQPPLDGDYTLQKVEITYEDGQVAIYDQKSGFSQVLKKYNEDLLFRDRLHFYWDNWQEEIDKDHWNVHYIKDDVLYFRNKTTRNGIAYFQYTVSYKLISKENSTLILEATDKTLKKYNSHIAPKIQKAVGTYKKTYY